jgi:hypothetical protein
MRLSPSSPTPHHALANAPACADPLHNKSIANQSLHQRSGFDFGTLEDLTTTFRGVKDLEKTPAEKLVILKSIKADIVFYLTYLRDDLFAMLNYEEQVDDLRRVLTPPTPENTIDLKQLTIAGRRLSAHTRLEVEQIRARQNGQNIDRNALIEAWDTFLSTITLEIKHRESSIIPQ